MPVRDYLDNVQIGFLYDSGNYPVDIEAWRFNDRAGAVLKFTLVGRFRGDSPKYAGKPCFIGLFIGTPDDPDCQDLKTQERTGIQVKEILVATGKRVPGRTLEDQLSATVGQSVNMRVGGYTDKKGEARNSFHFGKLRPGYAPSAGNSHDAPRREAPVALPPDDTMEVFGDE